MPQVYIHHRSNKYNYNHPPLMCVCAKNRSPMTRHSHCLFYNDLQTASQQFIVAKSEHSLSSTLTQPRIDVTTSQSILTLSPSSPSTNPIPCHRCISYYTTIEFAYKSCTHSVECSGWWYKQSMK